MTEDRNELPVSEVYRGVEIYGLQSPERVAEAKAQVDEVFSMNKPRSLAAFACDTTKAPEARLVAKHKALATITDRRRGGFDVDHLNAATIGIERRTTSLGRLMGGRQAGAEWWPREWFQEHPPAGRIDRDR